MHYSDRLRIIEVVLRTSFVPFREKAVVLELVLTVLVAFKNFIDFMSTKIATTTSANWKKEAKRYLIIRTNPLLKKSFSN